MKLDLDKDWWGWHLMFGDMTGELRRPLPVTGEFGLKLRKGGGSIEDFKVPPYITSGREFTDNGVAEFGLWEGDGYRAGYGPRDGDAVKSTFIYADSPNVPPEWRPAIGAALKEVAEKWPGIAIRFRPDHDAVPLAPALIDSFLSPPTGESDASSK